MNAQIEVQRVLDRQDPEGRKGGRTVVDVCCVHGVSSATHDKWKSKYGGMAVSDIQQMKDLEAENRKLKQMVANLSLEKMVLRGVVEKKASMGLQQALCRTLRRVTPGITSASGGYIAC